jgi:hypothetical protein
MRTYIKFDFQTCSIFDDLCPYRMKKISVYILIIQIYSDMRLDKAKKLLFFIFRNV